MLVQQVNDDEGNRERLLKRNREISFEICNLAQKEKEPLTLIPWIDSMEITAVQCTYAATTFPTLPTIDTNSYIGGKGIVLSSHVKSTWARHIKNDICTVCDELRELSIRTHDFFMPSKTPGNNSNFTSVTTNNTVLMLTNNKKRKKNVHSTRYTATAANQQLMIRTSEEDEEEEEEDNSMMISSSRTQSSFMSLNGALFIEYMKKKDEETNRRFAQEREENNKRFDQQQEEIRRMREENREERLENRKVMEGLINLIVNAPQQSQHQQLVGGSVNSISKAPSMINFYELTGMPDRIQGVVEQQLVAYHHALKDSGFNDGLLYIEERTSNIHVLHDGYYSLLQVLQAKVKPGQLILDPSIYNIMVFLKKTSLVHIDAFDIAYIWYDHSDTKGTAKEFNEKVILNNALHQYLFHTVGRVYGSTIFNFEEYNKIVRNDSSRPQYTRFTQTDARADLFPYPPESLTCLGTLKKTKTVNSTRGKKKKCNGPLCETLCFFTLSPTKYTETAHFQKKCFYNTPFEDNGAHETFIKEHFEKHVETMQAFVNRHQIIEILQKEFPLLGFKRTYSEHLFYFDGSPYVPQSSAGGQSKSTTMARLNDLSKNMREYNVFIESVRKGTMQSETYRNKAQESRRMLARHSAVSSARGIIWQQPMSQYQQQQQMPQFNYNAMPMYNPPPPPRQPMLQITGGPPLEDEADEIIYSQPRKTTGTYYTIDVYGNRTIVEEEEEVNEEGNDGNIYVDDFARQANDLGELNTEEGHITPVYYG
jgi:site-specific DNA-adenine methylase